MGFPRGRRDELLVRRDAGFGRTLLDDPPATRLVYFSVDEVAGAVLFLR
jgi:hypothetical protein